MRSVAVRNAAGVVTLVLAVSARALAGPGTVLSVSKSGDNVILSWTGTGTLYDGARATDGPFTNATTQFIGTSGTSHTYVGAVINSRSVEFFDVTDETEVNRGGNWNGGVLPALPPVIDTGDPSTNIGSLFIGSTGIIGGSGFSSIPEVNTVCFEGGVCTQATSASSTQVQFVTPPGAYTGDVTVTVGNQTSEPASSVVMLEDPASGWSFVSTIGFSRQDKSYWIYGDAGGVASIYRVYFDSGTGTWLREDRGGGVDDFLTCSTQTSRTGYVFCGDSQNFVPPSKTYYAQTSPASDLTSCIELPGAPGIFSLVEAVAVDANPTGASGRDVVYFAQIVNFGLEAAGGLGIRIKKVAADCSAILDSDYGNMMGAWGSIRGMAVDPVTGDLYVAGETTIFRVQPNESVQEVKDGFSSIRSVDVTREGADDPGVLLVSDAETVQAVALDNTSASPISVATVSGFTAASFGAQVSGGPWLASNVNRTVVVYNDGSSTFLEPHPLMDVTLSGPFEVRISSPATEQLPIGQSMMRLSAFGDTSFSHAVTRLQYRDGLSRPTCAWIGDPGPGAPQYDSNPPAPSECNKPRAELPETCPVDSTPNCCDNVDEIVAGGPGSLVEGGGLTSCKTCGGPQDPCSWEFRITNRYGGDNYKVYFAFDQDAEQFAATSDVYTAWKHVHIERERMCNRGGLLFQDYGATGECGGAGQPVCCGTGGQPPCMQVLLFDTANVSQDDVLVVFDEQRTFEDVTYTRTVTEPPVDNGNGSITVKLDSPLPHNVLASDADTGTGQIPIFSNGHSGGVCAPAHGFAESDTSRLPDAFSDGMISYHVAAYGLAGSGTVPFYSPVDFRGHDCRPERFSNIWFQKYAPGAAFSCTDPVNVLGCEENNHIHLIAAPRTASGTALGESPFMFNASYVYVDDIVDECNNASQGCTGDKLPNYNRSTTRHEFAHQFMVNSCTPPDFHDDSPGRNAWCGNLGGSCVTAVNPEQTCPMNVSVAAPVGIDLRADGVDRFCPEDLALGDPNCSMPREGAMRMVEDPQ